MKILLLVALLLVFAVIVVVRAQAATKAAPASALTPPRVAAAITMPEIEEEIRQLVRAQGAQPSGEIRAEATESSIGYRGAVEVGDKTRRYVDFASPEFEAANAGKRPLFDLLEALRVASLGSTQGPWYYLIIQADPGGSIDFEYFLEHTPLASIKDLRLGEYESVPSYVFTQRFDAERVAELSDFEVNAGIAAHVPDRLAAGRPVSPVLLELFATIDWEHDVNNGGMDQYFARRHSDYTGAARRELYPLVQAGLKRVGADEAADLFAESIALYAHFEPDVESARIAMGIPAVPRQDESDIGARYYTFQPDLDRLRAAYVRGHTEILVTSATKP